MNVGDEAGDVKQVPVKARRWQPAAQARGPRAIAS